MERGADRCRKFGQSRCRKHRLPVVTRRGLRCIEQTDEAIADLKQVQVLNPFCDDAILKLGSIYQQTAQWDKALALYNEAIEQRPDFAAAYKARGAVKII